MRQPNKQLKKKYIYIASFKCQQVLKDLFGFKNKYIQFYHILLKLSCH